MYFGRSLCGAVFVNIGAHVFGADTRVALADFLFSPDQLPRSFCDTWQLTQALGQATQTLFLCAATRAACARSASRPRLVPETFAPTRSAKKSDV